MGSIPKILLAVLVLSLIVLSAAYALSERRTVNSNFEDTVIEIKLSDKRFVGSVHSFFQSFDKNANNNLEKDEMVDFYNWVERNVKYRYDDENEKNPIRNSLVGDGRAGDDYTQSPEETLNEGAGDCEDMSMLELAFYKHWDYEGYMGIIELKPNEYHAFAMVDLGDTFPGALKYDIGKTQSIFYQIKEGSYTVVDNTYDKRIGSIENSDELNINLKFVRKFGDLSSWLF